MEQKIALDLYNYFSIEILENVGIDEPNQVQIDKVESLLKKITKIITKRPINVRKGQQAFQLK